MMEAPEWFNCCASGDACLHYPDPGPAKWFWSFVTTLETSFRANLVTSSTAFPVQDSKYAEEHLATDKTWCPRNFLHTYRLASLRYYQQRGGQVKPVPTFLGQKEGNLKCRCLLNCGRSVLNSFHYQVFHQVVWESTIRILWKPENRSDDSRGDIKESFWTCWSTFLGWRLEAFEAPWSSRNTCPPFRKVSWCAQRGRTRRRWLWSSTGARNTYVYAFTFHLFILASISCVTVFFKCFKHRIGHRILSINVSGFHLKHPCQSRNGQCRKVLRSIHTHPPNIAM